MASGRPWPGYSTRQCPVCKAPTGTHREPVNDERREIVVYHQHDDTSGKQCAMAGKVAAILAVAFTSTSTPRAAIA